MNTTVGLEPDVGPVISAMSAERESNNMVRNQPQHVQVAGGAGLASPNEGESGVPLAENEENEVAAAEVVSQTDPGDIDNHSEMELLDFPVNSGKRRGRGPPKSRTSSKSTEPSPSVLARAGAGSRSRPRKSHEPTPFLSIDNLPVSINEEAVTSEYQSAGRAKVISTNLSRGTPYVPANTPHLKSVSATSSQWSGPAYRAKKYVHATQGASPVNHSIKSPFKHAVTNQKKPEAASPVEKRPSTPSRDLKEKTALATYHVAKAVSRRSQRQAGGQQMPVRQNHLLKARLKPLYPVEVEGPTLNQCRGIQPQPQAYSDSPSRTLQRRRQLLANMPRELLERPQTVESVHRTSIASESPATNGLDTRERMMQDNYISPLDIIESPRVVEELMEGPAAVLIQQNHSEVIIQPASSQMPAENHVEQLNGISAAAEPVSRDDTFLTLQTTPTPRSHGNKSPSQEEPNQHLSQVVTERAGRESPRPSTVPDGMLRKAVRFADSVSGDGQTRAKSATAASRSNTVDAVDTIHKSLSMPNVSSPIPSVSDSLLSSVSHISGVHTDTVSLGIDMKDEDEDNVTSVNQRDDQAGVLAEVESFTSEDINKYVQSTIDLCREELAKENNPEESKEYSENNILDMSISSLEDKLMENNQSNVKQAESEDKQKSDKVKKCESCKDDVLDEDNQEDSDNDDNNKPVNHKQYSAVPHQLSQRTETNQNEALSSSHDNQNNNPSECIEYVPEAEGDIMEIDGNCNNNSNTTEAAENDMQNVFNVENEAPRKNFPVATRPRSRLGFWEDAYKPDPKFESSVTRVNGSSPTRGLGQVQAKGVRFNVGSKKKRPFSAKAQLESNIYVPAAAARAFGVKARPQSAGGPREFMEEEKKKLQRRPRPPSAQYRLVADRDSSEIQERRNVHHIDAAINPVSQAFERPRSGKPRPHSAKVQPQRPRLDTKRSKEEDYEDLFSVHGNKMMQAERDTREVYDVKALKKGLFESPKQLKAKQHIKQHKKKRRNSDNKKEISIPNDDAENEEDEILYLAGFESQPRSFSPQRQKIADAYHGEGQNQKVIGNIDDLEKWLNNVQSEVRTCVTEAQEAQNAELDFDIDEKDLLVCEEYETLEDVPENIAQTKSNFEQEVPDKVPEKDSQLLDDLMDRKLAIESEGLNPGIISSAIVSDISPGKHAYEMVVYHFEEDKMCAPVSLRKRPSSATRSTRSRPSSGKRVLQTAPVAPKESEEDAEEENTGYKDADENDENIPENPEEKPCTGAVSSYSVTMMGGMEGGLPKEVEDEESFMKMVLEQLPRPLPQSSVADDTLKGKEEHPAQEKGEEEKLGKLEVIAKPKEIIKPDLEEEMKPVASYPPVCFRINARPPPGFVYYFAYGTDMNQYRLQTYIQRNSLERQWGLLYGFKLVFNKRGEDIEAGGFPNLDFSPYSSVEGCLYLLTPQELQALDQFIGYPQHYEHVMLPVWLLNCDDPDNFGVAQYCVPALMYIAHDRWVQKDLVPSAYTMDQWSKGADLVTDNYRFHMQQQCVDSV